VSTITTYREAMPDVSVRTAYVGATIVASVRVDHPKMAPIVVAATDEDHAQRLASALRRIIALAGDAARAEIEDEYIPRLATAELDLLAARRRLAGCDDDD
jgi:hypothetical protein